ncbi:MAG: HEPN domain-containing protein [Thermoplasmata archaeon]|nr:HEPN domain-containing protein [Thermoplasmata archaeon]
MPDECLKYIEKARDFLEEADYLMTGGYWRAAINRAYYSMYHAARGLLSMKQVYPKTHRGVIRQFGLEFVKTGFVDEMYGKALIIGKEQREEADYGIELEFGEEEAEDILESAEEFLKKIEEVIGMMEKKGGE